MSSRPEITKALTHAAVMHWVKLRYGAFTELGLVKRGVLRADVVSVNYRRHIVVTEVKSSWEDYNNGEHKFGYLNFCDQMYYLFTQALWDSGKIPKPSRGIGVMVLDDKTGHLRTVVKAKVQDLMTEEERYDVITRMAFRSATFTKRNCKQRTRVYIK